MRLSSAAGRIHLAAQCTERQAKPGASPFQGAQQRLDMRAESVRDPEAAVAMGVSAAARPASILSSFSLSVTAVNGFDHVTIRPRLHASTICRAWLRRQHEHRQLWRAGVGEHRLQQVDARHSWQFQSVIRTSNAPPLSSGSAVLPRPLR